MGLRGRLRLYTLSGGTKAIHVWRSMNFSKEVTAAGSSLVLLDPSGKISEDTLHEWLMELEIKHSQMEEIEKED